MWVGFGSGGVGVVWISLLLVCVLGLVGYAGVCGGVAHFSDMLTWVGRGFVSHWVMYVRFWFGVFMLGVWGVGFL